LLAVHALIDANVEEFAQKHQLNELIVKAWGVVPAWQVVLTWWWFWWSSGFLVGVAAVLWLLKWFPEKPDGALTEAQNFAANSAANALQIIFENSDKFEVVDNFPQTSVVRRLMRVCVRNDGNGFLSDCKLSITGASPPPKTGHLPSALAWDFQLMPGAYKFVNVLGYAERPGSHPHPQQDDIIVAIPRTAGFFAEASNFFLSSASKQTPTIITLEASALECRPYKAHFKVWIDDGRRLRMELA
jgi:hypothetical protein